MLITEMDYSKFAKALLDYFNNFYMFCYHLFKTKNNEFQGSIDNFSKFVNLNLFLTFFLVECLVPSTSPPNFNNSFVSHDYIVLSWEKIHYLEVNGIMRKYNFTVEGILANGSLHSFKFTVEYDPFLSTFSSNITNLFPATIYNITIEGCTTPGCGPNATLVQQTDELGNKTILKSIC